MKLKNTLLLFAALTISTVQITFAQIGGKEVYKFTLLAPSARISALGGYQAVVFDDDLSVGFSNPAMLNPKMDLAIAFNHQFHYAGISDGYIGFAKHVAKLNMTFHAGMQYVNYGEFYRTDEYETDLGVFSPSEKSFVIGASKKLSEHFNIGANIKAVTSSFESYKSFGLLTDIAATYMTRPNDMIVTLMLKNAGAQLSTYDPNGDREKVAFDLQLGFSKKLAHLPFRFGVILHDLHRWDLLYDNPNQQTVQSIFDDQKKEPSGFSKFTDNFFRHFIFNGEFYFGENQNFMIRIAYNHMRKKEMQLEDIRSLAGFSGGFGFKVYKFRLDYGLSQNHAVGMTHMLGIATNLNAFKKTNKILD